MGTCSCCLMMKRRSLGNNNRIEDSMSENNKQVHSNNMNQTHNGFREGKRVSNIIDSRQKHLDQDYELFSYFKHSRQCDQIVRQFIIGTRKQQLQQQYDETVEKQTSNNNQRLRILQKNLTQYMQQLDAFFTTQFLSTFTTILSLSTNILNPQQYELLLQSLISMIGDKQQKLVTVKKILMRKQLNKPFMRRLLKDVLTLIYLHTKINSFTLQLSAITFNYLYQFNSSIKQHSTHSKQLENYCNSNENNIFVRSLKYFQDQKNSRNEDEKYYFLLKMRVTLITDNISSSKVFHGNKHSPNITQLTIKLILPTSNQTIKKQQHELHIGTFVIVSKNKNNKNNHYQQIIDLQFVIMPGTLIVFQTHPMRYICSLSVDQFLGKLYVVNQQFLFVKKQVISSKENNLKSTLKQNLLQSSSSQSKDRNYNQLFPNPYQYPAPKLSLTLQPIPIGVIDYFQRLKLTTKSMHKNIQAILTNNPLPLDMRSSFTSNTSYEQSFRFSRSATNRTQSQCCC